MLNNGKGVGIFCLDGQSDSSVRKALKKYGRVDCARDIDEALPLLAENEYLYYFVDADSPMAQVFIKHLRHDPHVAKPCAIVLLTENEEEDCEAWLVDTYITRSRFAQDVPFVFSHLKPESNSDSNVIPIASESIFNSGNDLNLLKNKARERSAGLFEGRKFSLSRFSIFNSSKLRDRTLGVSFEDASACLKPNCAEDAHRCGEHEREKPNYDSLRSAPFSCDVSDVRLKIRRAVMFFAACVAAGFVLWVVTVGPLSGSSSNRTKPKELSKSLGKAEKRKESLGQLFQVPVEQYAYQNSFPSGQSYPKSAHEQGIKQLEENQTTNTTNVNDDSNPTVGSVQRPTGSSERQRANETNRPPTVTIKGPVQVLHRQTAVYTAVAHDPDGDSISYSWGGQTITRNWSTPGVYQVSITVTDSKGLSATSTLTVRVI